MNFSEFLDYIKNLNTVSDFPTLTFTNFIESDQFSILFLNYLKSKFDHSCISIDIQEASLANLKQSLEIAFLGTKQIYFIKNFNELEDKQKKEFYGYIVKYNGPHSAIFFDTKKIIESNKNIISIDLPENINLETYSKLFTLFLPNITLNPNLSAKIFEKRNITLGFACQLIKYQAVLGKNIDTFFDIWLDKINPESKSLFDLSQGFFSKDLNKFLILWNKQKEDYPIEFWVSFFSEQIWQAYLFILRSKKLGIIEAKKKARFLPFLFMNKLWQNYTTEYLSQAHNNLYIFDYNLKNGLAENLDLWLYKFMLKQF